MTQPSRLSKPPSAPSHGSIAVLERLRTKLLDLTLANRLLNFKQDGARVVRVIDELPDQLFERLRAGVELELLPVPEPPKNHPLRAEANGEKKTRRAAAQSYAAEVGLATSFDLPEAKGKRASKHDDDAIQTLMFPPELEKALRGIASDARAAIEEKGSNILYLSFGFLEWTEADASDKTLLAPLLMLPVALRRGETDKKFGTYRFSVSYSNEDVLPNISLQEKLRRERGINLPELEDEDTPEAYFARVAARADLPENWRIRRQISLGLLSFSKLLMYRDLDPAAWPSGAHPAAHPRVGELLGGDPENAESVADENVATASEYDFEGTGSGPTPPVVPPIVIDADSSQHSAIVDAFAGKSLVIEGPPGTGKSQTIANLIAATMSSGRSVLFVAEKLTALEVVKRRLDECGLGGFCMELHSDKTQKTRLMEELKVRLDVKGTFRSPSEIDARIQVLNDLKQRLNSYAQRMNRVACTMGWTVHDVLWGTQRRRSLLGDQADLWKDATLRGAEQLSLARYEELRRCAGVFGKALAQVRAMGSLQEHPFWGVWASRPDPAFEQAFTSALERVSTACATARNEQATLTAVLGGEPPESVQALEALAARVDVLRRASHKAVLGAAGALRSPGARTMLAAWVANVASFRQLRANLQQRVPSADARQSLARLADDLFQVVAPQTTLEEVVGFPEHVARVEAGLGAMAALIGGFSTVIDEPSIGATFGAASAALETIALARRAPFDALGFRPKGSVDPDPLLEQAAATAAALRKERAELTELFDLELVPDAGSLELHAATCATAGFFSFFSGAYRAAKRQYAVIARSAQKSNDATMATMFRALASFQKRRAAFESDSSLQSILGPAFRGMDTDFEKVFAARAWQRDVSALQRRHRRVSGKLAALADAPAELLRELTELQRDDAVRPETLASDTRHLVAGFTDLEVTDETLLRDVQSALKAAHLRVAPLRAGVIAVRDSVRVRTIGELHALQTELRSLETSEQELNAAELPRTALGEMFARVDGPLEIARATIDYASAVFAPETPELIREYLVLNPKPDFGDRIVPPLLSLRNSLLAVQTAEDHLLKLGDVSVEHWYGAQPRSVGVIQAIRARADRALAERHALPAWASYLRARIALFNAGGDFIRDVAERVDRVDLTQLMSAAELVVYSSIAARVFAEDPDLTQHEGVEHASVREQFRKYDEELLRLERSRMAALIDARPVPAGTKGSRVKEMTERALLEHEMRKQRAHAPIRQLVNRAGGALRALKPCFMMSPRSVAQYLEAGSHEFDLVVMDEASQLRPEDAIGAVLRGKQLVVVGDSKQLPPTSFFAAEATDGETDPDDEEGEAITDNKESILDLSRTVFRSVRRLRWHYRSRHGSLIAFSNDRYYDGNLIVFPSAHDEDGELGVRLVRLDDATYADGRNRREAEAVVDAVVEHLRTRPRETLGIVALNIRQKDLIEQTLFDRLKDEPELRARFERSTEGDGGFIKNLEAVQGDERDVIYISVTYGPAVPGGSVARRFGPINAANGWRRLNVLFTRARRRVVVFSSFAPGALGDRGLSRGARDLRDYIAFAASGTYQEARVSEREPDSDFEVEVADVLRSEGYSVTPQVGVAGYFIDLGVRSMNGDGRFVLGIECDGAPYHSSFSARDRDRLRQQVLEGLGWKIHRIWSTDWYRDNRSQRRRLVQAVRAAEAGRVQLTM